MISNTDKIKDLLNELIENMEGSLNDPCEIHVVKDENGIYHNNIKGSARNFTSSIRNYWKKYVRKNGD